MNPVIFRGAFGTLLFSLAGWFVGSLWMYEDAARITPDMHMQRDVFHCVQDKKAAELAKFTLVNHDAEYLAECKAQVQSKYHEKDVPELGQ